jgi:hypothetical protein
MHGPLVANLNTPQRQAVATLISRSFYGGFLAIQGPPGTGKLTVLTAMIAVIGTGELDTGPSNSVVVNVAIKSYVSLRDRFQLPDFVVFGENCNQVAHFLSPQFRGENFATFMRDDEEAKERLELRADGLKRECFARWLHRNESQDHAVSELEQLCPFINSSGREGMRRLAQLLSCSKVAFSTSNSFGSHPPMKLQRTHSAARRSRPVPRS